MSASYMLWITANYRISSSWSGQTENEDETPLSINNNVWRLLREEVTREDGFLRESNQDWNDVFCSPKSVSSIFSCHSIIHQQPVSGAILRLSSSAFHMCRYRHSLCQLQNNAGAPFTTCDVTLWNYHWSCCHGDNSHAHVLASAGCPSVFGCCMTQGMCAWSQFSTPTPLSKHA